ncbi:hypothetical protein [Micromonospora andamanensis]|uniref:hypothetical protein n=1 Tax=Micromonospora andamanensis TaxID=1287068 RepID=UPI00194E7FD1|nr:hypothetical protein [Micromonospora andamanensis]GIJ36697.1 hypothetical protein Vwe01_00220 [Micromonospora andamanensis]
MTELHLHMSEGLVVRPGDTLVVAMSSMPTRKEVNEMVDKLEAALPEIEIVVVGGASALAAYRPHAVESSTIDTRAELGATPGLDAADHPSMNGEGRVESLQVRGAETPR